MVARPKTLLRFGLLFVLQLAFGAAASAATPGLADLQPVAPVVACASLAAAKLDAAVGAPVAIDGATQADIGGAAYCQVKGVIAPNNHFEARLPVAGWTQRYVQLGCGGLCGVLQIRVEHAEQCDPVNSHGLVLASTDMGHSGHGMGDGGFGNDPALRTDFAYRGVHLTALAVKALIKLYYGQPQRYAYFSGCSDGGREALMEAERFPDDFNGIAAGAPALNFQLQNTFYHAWMAVSNHRPDGSAILLAAKLPALHAAALAACDALDGLKDGEIDNPQACRFDPAAARCAPGQAPSDACLTPEEVAVARKFYQGPTDSSGRRFLAGGPQVGSELAWRGVYVPETPDGMVVSTDAALGTIKYLAFAQNPPASYTLKDFKFDQSTLDALKTEHPLYDAGDTDLSAFQANGGKLLMWHGWSDPHISPLNSIAFYTGVQAKLGADTTKAFARLFLFPGLYHCGGGDGLSEFDVLSPLMAWVESGAAPQQIIAGRAAMQAPMGPPPPGAMGPPPAGAGPIGPPPGPPPGDMRVPSVNRARPVFAFPLQAQYKGSGSIDEAANFVAVTPAAVPSPGVWLAQGFIGPDFHRN